MGVVFGDINFYEIVLGYDFFKGYCLANGIEVITDYPDEMLIVTANIPNLKVINLHGTEIKGQGQNIEGIDSDVFILTILGVPYSFLKRNFLIM